MKFFSLVAGLAVLATEALALFDDVSKLTTDNWADLVDGNPDEAWMVVFYADWCPFCESFEKEFSAAAQDPALEGKRIRFGAVDVMANRDLVTKFGIQRSPTVKVFGRDRSAPVDYSGHRKHADVVSYCGEYCAEHDYLGPYPVEVVEEAIPEPEIYFDHVHEEPAKPAGPSYQYNIDHIVYDIAGQHDKRIQDAQTTYKTDIEKLNTDLEAELAKVAQEYEEKFNQLVIERKAATENVRNLFQKKAAERKTTHARDIADWDADAISTIESIIQGHSLNKDLTDFIPSLGKDWLNISWNENNRRPIAPAKPDPLDYGLGGFGPNGPTAPEKPTFNAGDYGFGGAAPQAPEQPHYGYGYDGYGPYGGDYNQGPYGGDYNQGPYGGDYSQGPYGGDYNQGPYGGDYSQGPYGGDYSQGPYGGDYNQGPYGGDYSQGPYGGDYNQGPYDYNQGYNGAYGGW